MQGKVSWVQGLACAAVLAWGAAAEAQWGDIKGKVLLDGAAPEVKLLAKKGDAAVKDAAVCAAENIPSEEVVVDAASKGIANVAVYLRKAPAKSNPELKPADTVQLVYDQLQCRFTPHMSIVQAGQQVELLNADAIAHNTRSAPVKNSGFNLIVPPNTRQGNGIKVPMKLAENVPVKLSCDIHPWMTGWWVVVDHPYAAVTDKDGNFTIKGLPEGEHEFRVWQEKVGYLEKSLKVKVVAGKETEVPTIKVPVKTLFP